jgi:hypothetical protein
MAEAPPTAAQEFASIGTGISGIGGIIPGLAETLFGADSSQALSALTTKSGTVTEQLDIEEAGVQKILQDILGSEQGLAAIFSEEQVSGLYGSTVAAQASGDLLTKLAGEIAKLTAKKVTTTDLKEEVTQETTAEKEGLIPKFGGFLKEQAVDIGGFVMEDILGQPKEGDKKNWRELLGLPK